MNISLPKSAPKLEAAPIFAKKTTGSSVEIVLLLLFTVLFYWFIASPKSQSLAEAQKKKQELLDEEGKISGKVQALKKLIQEMKLHPKEISLLDEALPLDSRQTKLQMLVASLAGSAGVSVGDITVSGKSEEVYASNPDILKNPYKPTRSLKKMITNINVFGNYEQLSDFIKKLENSGRLIEITSLALAPSDNNELDLKISANSYYFTP